MTDQQLRALRRKHLLVLIRDLEEALQNANREKEQLLLAYQSGLAHEAHEAHGWEDPGANDDSLPAPSWQQPMTPQPYDPQYTQPQWPVQQQPMYPQQYEPPYPQQYNPWQQNPWQQNPWQ